MYNFVLIMFSESDLKQREQKYIYVILFYTSLVVLFFGSKNWFVEWRGFSYGSVGNIEETGNLGKKKKKVGNLVKIFYKRWNCSHPYKVERIWQKKLEGKIGILCKILGWEYNCKGVVLAIF